MAAFTTLYTLTFAFKFLLTFVGSQPQGRHGDFARGGRRAR